MRSILKQAYHKNSHQGSQGSTLKKKIGARETDLKSQI